MRSPSSAWVLLLFALATALPFLPTGPGLRWLPMDPNIAPPFVESATSAPGDTSGSDLPAFTWPNLVHAARHRVLPTLLGIADGDPGALHWNPGQLCGTPFLATQNTFALSPVNLLPWLDPPVFQFALVAWIHAFLACVGCWLLYGSLTGDRGAAAVVAGLAFGCGPWMTAHHDTLASMTGAAAPWLFWFARRVVDDGGPGSRLGTATTFAVAAFAGMIQLLQVTCAGLLAALPWMLPKGASRPRLRVVSLACALLLGIALAAPQLLPLAEIAVEAPRARSSAALQEKLAIPPSEWLTFGIAEYAGTPPAMARAGLEEGRAMPAEDGWPTARLFGARTTGGATYMESVGGPAAVALVLAWLGLIAGAGRVRVIGSLLFVVGFLVATHTPLFAWIQSIPTVAVGNPRRWLLLCALGSALLAGEGSRVLAEAGTARRRMAILLALPALLPFVIAFVAPETAAAWLTRATGCAPDLARVNVASLVAELWPTATALGLSFLFIERRIGPAAWIVLIILESAVFGHRVNPWIPSKDPYPPTRTTAFLVADADRERLPQGKGSGRDVPWRVARIEGTDPQTWLPPLPPNTPMLFGLRDAQGYEGLLPRRYEELWNAIEPGSVHEHHYPKPLGRPDLARLPIFDFMGVKWFLATRADVPPGTVRRFADAGEKTAAFENPDWRPWASTVGRLRVVDDDASVLKACVDPAFDPSRETVVKRSEMPEDLSAGSDLLASASNVRVERLATASATFAVTSDAPCILTIAETFHPGWRAHDGDGRPLTLFPVNHAFQGVFVPKGVSTVVWSFRSSAWTFGIMIAIVGLSVLLADGILFRRRKLPPCT